MVQGLRFHTSNAGDTGSILGQETKILHQGGAAKIFFKLNLKIKINK